MHRIGFSCLPSGLLNVFSLIVGLYPNCLDQTNGWLLRPNVFCNLVNPNAASPAGASSCTPCDFGDFANESGASCAVLGLRFNQSTIAPPSDDFQAFFLEVCFFYHFVVICPADQGATMIVAPGWMQWRPSPERTDKTAKAMQVVSIMPAVWRCKKYQLLITVQTDGSHLVNKADRFY